MTAGGIINSLIRKADAMRQTETILARIERRANELSALEWEVLHKGALDEELAPKVDLSRREMAAQFGKLDRLDVRLASMHEVRKSYAAYLQPLQQEFALLANGHLKAASELDEAQVDPAFDRLCITMNEAEKEFHELAASTLRKVQAWIFIVSFTGAGTIGLLFWRFYQKQQIAAVATAEQRVLQRANEQLRVEIAERAETQRKLEQMQGELIKASRHAGMQEVATGVLHNVGNVLNSVNVTAGLLKDGLQKSQVQNLVKATQLLRDHAADTASFLTNDPRGQRLPGYLLRLTEHLVSEQASWRNELIDLGKDIEHIKEIVAMQQGYAKLSGAIETVSVDSLLEDALRMNGGGWGGTASK